MKKKILLLHGWDWRKYPKFVPLHQWENRQKFMDLLGEQFVIEFPTIPGFSSTSPVEESWGLGDYSDWLGEVLSKSNYDAILGQSFGGAIAAHWVYETKSLLPLILISPAIVRDYKAPKVYTHTKLSKLLPAFCRDFVRNVFLRFVIRNHNHIHGSSFLRKTYRRIVGVDLSEELRDILSRRTATWIIFGKNDTATPPSLLFARLPEAEDVSIVIQNAGHNILGEKPEEIVQLISKLLK